MKEPVRPQIREDERLSGKALAASIIGWGALGWIMLLLAFDIIAIPKLFTLPEMGFGNWKEFAILAAFVLGGMVVMVPVGLLSLMALGNIGRTFQNVPVAAWVIADRWFPNRRGACIRACYVLLWAWMAPLIIALFGSLLSRAE